MHGSRNHVALNLLAVEMADLARRADAVAHRMDREDDSDLRALRNFIALAPFAVPREPEVIRIPASRRSHDRS